MTKQCEIVQDLLPLYIDRELSRDSMEYVETHVTFCEHCSVLKAELEKSKQYDLKMNRLVSHKSKPSPQELEFITRLTRWKRNSAFIGICLLLFLTFLFWMYVKENLEPQPVDKEIPIENETSYLIDAAKGGEI